ncbi:MAG: hypothetical protein R3E09_11245 [Novosphingobium sp.]
MYDAAEHGRIAEALRAADADHMIQILSRRRAWPSSRTSRSTKPPQAEGMRRLKGEFRRAVHRLKLCWGERNDEEEGPVRRMALAVATAVRVALMPWKRR